MARRIRIRNLMFHSANCLKAGIDEALTEISTLDPDADISFDNLTSLRNPMLESTTEDATWGEFNIQLLQCSRTACGDAHTQRADASRSGWFKVRLL